MGENIGAAARAMKNFGLTDLRLVSPKDGWPNSYAEVCSANALDLLQAAKLYTSVDDAIADLRVVYAATARIRFMNKDYVLSRDLPSDLPHVGPIGILFGRENCGLTNAEVSRADKIVSIDASEEYPVLNLAQSVACVAYELFNGRARAGEGAGQAGSGQGQAAAGKAEGGQAEAPSPPSSSSAAAPSAATSPPEPFHHAASSISSSNSSSSTPTAAREDLLNKQELCTKGELEAYLSALEGQLHQAGFFDSAESKRASVTINIRNLFGRIPKLSTHEVSALHGMLGKLSGARKKRGSSRGGDGNADL